MVEGKVPKDVEVEPPTVMLVDSGDTSVHQIYAYAGTKPLNVALLDAVDGKKLPVEKHAPLVSGADLTLEELRALPVKEYLYRTVLPALLPGLQVITRDRPPDPVLWLALYLLRHPKQYSKVLAADSAAAAAPPS